MFRTSSILRIPLLYGLFGLAWILFTDRVLLWLAPDVETLVRWQTAKGWVFVGLSTVLIFSLLGQAQRRQRRARERERESELRYRLLFENNPLPMWLYDLESLSFLAANNAAVDKYGYTVEEFRQMTLRDIRPAGDVPRLLDDVAHTTDRLNFAGEWQHRRKDGTVFPVEIISHALTVDERAARLVVANDISERKQAEAALRESERQFRRAVEEAPFPIIIHAEDGEVLTLNQAWTELSGYTHADIPTIAAWTEQAYGSGQKAVREQIERLYDLPQRVEEGEFTLASKQGEQRIWDFSSTPLGRLADGRLSVISMATDVTERKQAEEALRESETRYRLLFRQLRQVIDSVPEGVLLLDAAGKILVANSQAQQHLRLLADAEIGEKLTQLGQRTLDQLLTAPPPGAWHETEVDGRAFTLLAQPLEAGPVPQGWVLVIREVTEERNVVRQMQQQARLAAVGQLAAGIAHDFNNIINVILLYVELIEKETPAAADQRLATIKQQAQQAAKLVEQILDFSRRTLLEREPLDLRAFLEREVSLLARILPENIEMTLNADIAAGMVKADASRLQQVLMNLALNARDAMPRGGSLSFELSRWPAGDSGRAPIPGMAPGRWLRLAIRDTGAGIAPEFLDHVFEPFFTTKAPGKGTGLGLAQAHGIVGQHGGYMTVTSEVDAGTTFTIYLPALSQAEQAA